MAREMKLLTWRKQTCSRSINFVLSCSIIMPTTILINCAVIGTGAHLHMHV